MMSKEKIDVVGFIGLGIMGQPIATHLLKAGYSMFVFNRTPEKMQSLLALGATACESPAKVAQQAKVIFTMVSDTEAVEQVLFGPHGIVTKARPGTIIIDLSTISIKATERFSNKLQRQEISLFDAPVSGGEQGAIAGSLTVFVGGDKKQFAQVEPILKHFSYAATYLGNSGSGQAAKACNQILCSVNLMAIAEALTLGKAFDLDLNILLKALSQGSAQSWLLDQLGPQMAHNNLKPGFMVDLMQKDLTLVLEGANIKKIPAPAVSLAQQLFISLQAQHKGQLGMQAIKLIYERLANSTLLP